MFRLRVATLNTNGYGVLHQAARLGLIDWRLGQSTRGTAARELHAT